jgi:hypothetical protein
LVEDLADAILALLMRSFRLPVLDLQVAASAELVVFAPAALPWEAASPRSLEMFSNELPSAVDVFGIPVLATAEIEDQKLRLAAERLARRFDANADGLIDDPQSTLELQRAGYFVILHGDRPPNLPPTAERKAWRTFTISNLENLERSLDPRVPRKKD